MDSGNLNVHKVLKALKASPFGLKSIELVEKLELDAKGRHRLRVVLEELENEGKIEKAPGSRYRLPGSAEAAPPAPVPPPAAAPTPRARRDGKPAPKSDASAAPGSAVGR